MNIYGTNVAIHDDICRPPHKNPKENETSYRLRSPVEPGGFPPLRELTRNAQAAAPNMHNVNGSMIFVSLMVVFR